MSLGSILTIVSALLGIAKWFLNYTQQKQWMDAGAAQAIQKGIEDADQLVQDAKNARQTVRDQHMRDPSSVLSDDEFKRPD